MSRRPVKTHTFRRRRWLVEDNVKLPDGEFGMCEEPRLAGCEFRRIQIPIDGEELHELDTIIHESIHASCELDEQCVTESATDIARLLWRLGWRKIDD